MSNTIVSNFGNYTPIDPAVIAYVNAAIKTANADSVQASPPSVENGIAQYVDTTGKLIKSTPYTMPDTLGVAGQVLTVDAGGDIVYGSGGSANPFNQDLNTFNDVSFNSVTTANITGPTTVSVAGNDRIVVDSADTNLFSQNIFTGPSGSYIRLKNNDTFEIGTRSAINGAIECNPNSMAIVGRQARSSVVLTDTTITTSLAFGSARIDREIMTVNDQEFRDGSGANRLKVSISDGVTINNAFSLPTTTGSVGDILTRTGTSATTWTAPPASPTYLPTLTVTNLSQGPSALVQNYTLPNYAPPPNSVLASATTYIMTFTVNASISFRVNDTIRYREEISSGVYLVSDIVSRLETTTRSVLNANNIIADIVFGYNNITDRFEMVLTNQVTPSNFVNLWWEAYDPLSPIPNNNNLFGLGPVIDSVLTPPPIQTRVCQFAPIGVSLGTDCVWRSLASVQIPGIQSDSGASSIQCEDVGVGQSGIISYGNYNLNNGSLNNIGNINALDNCYITTNTTQIENGLGELNISINSLPRITQDAIQTKIECGTSALNLAALSDGLTPNTTTYLSASNIGNTANISAVVLPDSYNVYQNNGSIQRLIVDDTKSALFSKNGVSGPAGSLLELNNDNTFTLGCFAANNGIIECRPDSLAMYGNSANSSFIMTGSNITTALSNGSGRVDREVISTASQSFRDPTGTERLRVEGNGVVINNTYTLTNDVGTLGQVLSTNGSGQTGWQYPVKIQDSGNPSSFINCDSENIYVSTFYPTGKLQLGIQASISAGQVLTSTDTLGSAAWQTPQIYSIFSQIVDQTVVSTAAETTIIGGGTPTSTLTIPPNFFTPGMTFRYTTGGLFRTSANNISARFRLRNSGVLFDSGLLVFSNRVITATPWNVEATFAYMGGTVMVTNFNFQYNAGNDARGFTAQQSNNTFNATVSNTLNFTIQWSVASADNTITTNFGVVQKIY